MNKALILSLFMSISNIVIADFVKLSNEGDVLDFENSNWSCVLDQKTSLVWEVKDEKEGLQYTMNTYTWFDGDTGRKINMYSNNCYWGEGCNTQLYIDDINEAQLCTYSNWRLPTMDELKTIINYYSDHDILIDFDENGDVVGIEMLNASKLFNVDKFDLLKNLVKFEVIGKITKDL